jgi:hypothetical protein
VRALKLAQVLKLRRFAAPTVPCSGIDTSLGGETMHLPLAGHEAVLSRMGRRKWLMFLLRKIPSSGRRRGIA